MKKVLVTVERWECSRGHMHTSQSAAENCEAKKPKNSRLAKIEINVQQGKLLHELRAAGKTWKEAAEAVGLGLTVAQTRFQWYERWLRRPDRLKDKNSLEYGGILHGQTINRLYGMGIQDVAALRDAFNEHDREWWAFPWGIADAGYCRIVELLRGTE